jgi:hypothetical protein
MPIRLACPYLAADVEWSEDRQLHIAMRHPDLLPTHQGKVAETLARPDMVCRSARSGNARLFSRWYTELQGGKHVVVVVMTEPGKEKRHWIITAYLARRLAEGVVEWKRN